MRNDPGRDRASPGVVADDDLEVEMAGLRQQVVSFQPHPVITQDDLVVDMDTVIYVTVLLQVPVAAYPLAVECDEERFGQVWSRLQPRHRP
jgi:hypothetical protein